MQDPDIGAWEEGHLDLSVAERRERRHIRLPRRFEDGLPETFEFLPTPELLAVQSDPNPHHSQPQTGMPTSSHEKVIQSPPNSYGLFRRYYSHTFPSHDPDSELTIDDLSDIPSGRPTSTESSNTTEDISCNYGPYPNRSSFLLGEWNWDGQVQKSKSAFKSLIKIVSDPDFYPSDVRDTQWEAIDAELGSSDITETDAEPFWLQNDASWTKTPITISVPFHRYTVNPGPRDYVVVDFYHRSIVSILRESLSHSMEGLHFHYEPYELYWKPSNAANPTRVFGELYTSPAFIDAHQDLQSLPAEPGCDLPRFVAGLMLASDSTQLTSFGNAKIWPQYLYFGNHSKYQRCKPSRHLCQHVAYFHKVSCDFYLHISFD